MANPKSVTFAVKRVTVIEGRGPDQVCIDTWHESSYPPEVDDEPLSIRFDTPKGKAVDYLRDKLGFSSVEVINVRTGMKRGVVLKLASEPVRDPIPHEPKTRP